MKVLPVSMCAAHIKGEMCGMLNPAGPSELKTGEAVIRCGLDSGLIWIREVLTMTSHVAPSFLATLKMLRAEQLRLGEDI